MYLRLLCWTGFICSATSVYLKETIVGNYSSCLDNISNGSVQMVTISNMTSYKSEVCPIQNDGVVIIEVIPPDKTKFTYRDLYICWPQNTTQGTLIFNGVIQETKPTVAVSSICEVRDSITLNHKAHKTTTFLLLRMHPISQLKVIYSPYLQNRKRSTYSEQTYTGRKQRVSLHGEKYRDDYGIINSSACGKSRGCFRDGENGCQHFECNYFLSYWTDNSVADIEISGKSNGWVAVGFSSDKKMGDDDIFACLFEDQVQTSMRVASFIDPQPNVRPQEKKTFATLTHSERKNEFIYCRFTVPLKRDENEIDLTNEWIHLYARGDISLDGLIEKHTEIPLTSRKPVSLLERSDIINVKYSNDAKYTENSKYTDKPEVIDSSECGRSRGCFRDGENGCQHFECNYFLSYWTDNSVADIEISGKSNGWVAVGFSSDRKMGGDDILACLFEDYGRTKIRVASFNDPHPGVRPEEKKTFANLKHFEHKNGYIYCRFDVPVKRGDNDVDLTNEWTQLYARGGISSAGLMEKHTKPPLISKHQISIVQRSDVQNAAFNLFPLRQVYCILMLVLFLVRRINSG